MANFFPLPSPPPWTPTAQGSPGPSWNVIRRALFALWTTYPSMTAGPVESMATPYRHGPWGTDLVVGGRDRGSISPSADQALAVHRRQVQRGQQAGLALDHSRNRVDEAHGGGLEAARVVVAVTPHELHVDGVGGLTGDDHPVTALPGRLRPVGGEVVAEPGDVFEHDDGPAVLHAPQLEVQGRRRALLDRAGVDLEGLRCRHPLIPFDQIAVELHLEAGGQLTDDTAPGHGHHAGLEDHRHVLQWTSEAHDVEEDHALVVRGVVEHLGHADLVDLLTHPGQHEGV